MCRAFLLVSMLLMTSVLSGCTLVGLGIGASSPSSRMQVVEEEVRHADPGDVVRVHLDSGKEISGTVGASDERTVEVTRFEGRVFTTATNMVRVPIEHVDGLRRRRLMRVASSNALTGAAYGMVADAGVALVALLVYGLTQVHASDLCFAICHP
jgi:hypothetical protein